MQDSFDLSDVRDVSEPRFEWFVDEDSSIRLKPECYMQTYSTDLGVHHAWCHPEKWERFRNEWLMWKKSAL